MIAALGESKNQFGAGFRSPDHSSGRPRDSLYRKQQDNHLAEEEHEWTSHVDLELVGQRLVCIELEVKQ